MSSTLNLPPLLKLTTQEAHCIANTFRIYDYKASGRIPGYLAAKLCKTLGVNIHESNFAPLVTLQELLLLIDRVMPDPEPALLSSLISFANLASVKVGELEEDAITPQVISSFMESLGRPPASLTEASLLLNAMLEYDDCSDVPCVTTDVFNHEIINFAKKTNAFKDYRP
jgi:hypothetical protein